MFQIIPLEEIEKWNNIVKSFKYYDSYYLAEYVKPFVKFENNNAFLIYYKEDLFELCYVVQKNDIADDINFKNHLEKSKFYDLITPYGYGGPLIKNYSEEKIINFYEELKKYAKENNIVTQFFRFHPITKNHTFFKSIAELKTFKKTIYIDLESPETIYSNMNDKCRNMVKKATKNNIQICIDNSFESKKRFQELYIETMQRNNATKYYFFKEDFFEEIFKQLGKDCNLFVAKYQDIIISSALIYQENKILHYHLSAADRNYMKLAGNNLLLYKTALYGCENGYKYFHLGGGVEKEDGLFIFKKSFNKNGLLDFYIGRNIFDKDKYNELIEKRKAINPNFELNANYMIGYRQK